MSSFTNAIKGKVIAITLAAGDNSFKSDFNGFFKKYITKGKTTPAKIYKLFKTIVGISIYFLCLFSTIYSCQYFPRIIAK